MASAQRTIPPMSHVNALKTSVEGRPAVRMIVTILSTLSIVLPAGGVGPSCGEVTTAREPEAEDEGWIAGPASMSEADLKAQSSASLSSSRSSSYGSASYPLGYLTGNQETTGFGETERVGCRTRVS